MKRPICRALLVMLSVLLCHLSLPGGAVPFLAVVCLVPLGLALYGASPMGSFACAYSCGFLGWLTPTTGLAIGVSSYLQLTSGEALLYLAAFCAYQALPYGLFGLLCGIFQWGAFPAAACLTVLVSLFPSPLPLGPAHSLYVFPAAIQVLDLGGVPLLLFLLCLVNWLFVDLVLRIRSGRSVRPCLLALLSIVAAVLAYGQVRLMQFHREEAAGDPTRRATIAAIQPNISLRRDRGDSLETLLRMSEQAIAANPHVELVVWPETPGKLGCARGSANRDQLIRFAVQHHTPLLVDCVQPAAEGGDVNTALLLSRGGEAQAYGKQKLFPFAEYVPGERSWPSLRRLTRRASRYVAGTDETLFQLKDSVVAVAAICYEILFPGHLMPFIGRGGNLLVNATNDAWFGESRIPAFLIAAGVFQATGFHVPLVRVSNSGNSLFVNAGGELVPGSKTPNFSTAIAVSAVFVPRDRSPYSSLGNGFLCVLALSWGAALARKKNRTGERP